LWLVGWFVVVVVAKEAKDELSFVGGEKGGKVKMNELRKNIFGR